MPILVICHDAPDGTALRKQHHQSHLAYIKKMLPMICIAGPMRQGARAIENKQHDSGFFIYDTNDIAIAHKLLNNDPYAKAGVYQQVSFAEIDANAGYWIEGTVYK
jgi:uncharacterized protein YciI